MSISCPGSEPYSNYFTAHRFGPNPFVSFFRAIIALLIDISRSPLRALLLQECDGNCDKEVTGPEFSNFTVRNRLRPANPAVGRPAMWSCRVGVQVDAKVECIGLVIEASDEENFEELLAYLNDEEQKKC